MPLDEFQKAVLQVLSSGRTAKMSIAGGSVLQRYGVRLSDDFDIFNIGDGDLLATANADIQRLGAAGYDVIVHRPHDGLVEATVANIDAGMTKVQWVDAGELNFFQPVQDDEFGWRLHIADLCVNKALAAGGRRVVRDYVDLWMIHKHIMPLWHLAWSAPGKDESWSPRSLIEHIAATSGFRQSQLDDDVVSTIPLDIRVIGTELRAAIDEARSAIETLELSCPNTVGRLIVSSDGTVARSMDDACVFLAARPDGLDATPGGTLSTVARCDDYLQESLRLTYGDEPGFEPPRP